MMQDRGLHFPNAADVPTQATLIHLCKTLMQKCAGMSVMYVLLSGEKTAACSREQLLI